MPERVLPDHLQTGLRAIFVGINPSIRSAETGHHYAGPNNRFWDLIFVSGLIPERLSYLQDRRLLQYGLGLTNIVPRMTRSSAELTREDFIRGGRALTATMRRLRPGMLVLVGITVYRELLPSMGQQRSAKIQCGVQSRRLSRVPIYVLPNPSGRNAHFSYQDMLTEWEGLARLLDHPRAAGAGSMTTGSSSGA